MNFEDQLKNLTQDSRKNEELEKLRLEELRRIAKQKEDILLNIKKLVENEFKSVQKYFPNTSILPTHTIENGKIIPRMGTYHCCLLEFSPNNTYGIDDEYLIGIKVEIDDDLNIKLYTATLNSDQFFNNKFFNILEAFKTKILIQDFYFEGSYDPQSITSKTQKQLLEVIKDIKS